jgi:hypothetical protein
MSSTLARLLVAMLLLGAVSAAGSAQFAPRDARRNETSVLLTPGAHVRVRLPHEHAWTGRLVALKGDTMLVRDESGRDTSLVSLSQPARVDVSVGMQHSRHLVRNTVIGLGLGSSIGWLVGSSMVSGGCHPGDPCSNNTFCFFCDFPPSSYVAPPPVTDHASSGTVIGGLIGGTFAMLVSLHRSEEWRPVPNSRRRTAITLTPGGGRVAIAF